LAREYKEKRHLKKVILENLLVNNKVPSQLLYILINLSDPSVENECENYCIKGITIDIHLAFFIAK